jgi:hypothetical protein
MKLIARIALFALLFSMLGGRTFAGTTGSLTGVAVDEASTLPLAGATVNAVSPSQRATTTTDARGNFSFVSLAPDTYTISVELQGYRSGVASGVTIFADQIQRVSVSLAKALREIASTRTTGSSLVRPGQTSDVYTLDKTQTQNAQALGGGGGLYQTYAGLSSVPGVYVPQNGLNQGQNNSAPFIRGGNFTQVGYEFDGIPVQREYDGYVGTTQGTTGQQELQVYTGGGPASSAGEALAGYVNQVIKTGTYPGDVSLTGTLGSPSFYHYLSGEVAGATPDGRFSYYVGSTGWNQYYRYGDAFGGGLAPNASTQSLVPWSASYFGSPGQNGSAFPIPYAAGYGVGPSDTQSRETVANVHIHLGPAGKSHDDIQLLGDIGRQLVHVADDVYDLGGQNSEFWQWANGGARPTYPTATIYTGPVFSQYDPALATTYRYPSTTPGQSVIDPTLRGSEDSNNSLFKIQYQHNFGSNAYARVYAYSNYSSWFVYDPIGGYYLPLPESGILGLLDDEVSTRTRGVAAQFADQLDAHDQLQGFGSYTYSNDLRWYNSTPYDGGFTIQLRGTNGSCYDVASGASANCYNGTGYNSATLATGGSITSGSAIPHDLVVPGGAPAGTQYQVVQSGYNVVIGQPTPGTTTFSLDDTWQNDKLTLDFGLRYNNYLYGLGDTTQQGVVGGSNALYFSQFNLEHCYNTASQALTTVSAGAACPTGSSHTTLSNDTQNSIGFSVFEPRVSGTYRAGADTVVRFSAGTFSQPTRAAYIQYDPTTDLASYIASHFLQYGFTTPSHAIPPQISHNYDLSFEQRLPKADASISLTPFYRLTNNQTQAFILDPSQSSFQSGLNVGTLRAFGYEALARVGDFNRDGFSGQVSFTYTNAKIRYNDFAGTSTNVIDQLNNELNVGQYNALTAKGGGSPCYASGARVGLVGGACPAGSIANPYYSQPLQPTAPLAENGWYSPYNLIPTGNAVGAAWGYDSVSYDVPEVLEATVQWRHKGWRVVPDVQYDLGFRYSTPFAWTGYDPSSATCAPGSTLSCATLYRPDPYTGSYDGLGTFESPSTLSLGLQVAKDISKTVTVSAILTNIVQQCYTHGYAWETGGSHVCSYAQNPTQASGGPYVGNATNPNVTNKLQSDPYGYAPYTGSFPFGAFVSLTVKL